MSHACYTPRQYILLTRHMLWTTKIMKLLIMRIIRPPHSSLLPAIHVQVFSTASSNPWKIHKDSPTPIKKRVFFRFCSLYFNLYEAGSGNATESNNRTEPSTSQMPYALNFFVNSITSVPTHFNFAEVPLPFPKIQDYLTHSGNEAWI